MRFTLLLAIASVSTFVASAASATTTVHCNVLSDAAHVRVVASDAKSGKFLASVEHQRTGKSHALSPGVTGDATILGGSCTLFIQHHLSQSDSKALLGQLR